MCPPVLAFRGSPFLPCNPRALPTTRDCCTNAHDGTPRPPRHVGTSPDGRVRRRESGRPDVTPSNVPRRGASFRDGGSGALASRYEPVHGTQETARCLVPEEVARPGRD